MCALSVRWYEAEGQDVAQVGVVRGVAGGARCQLVRGVELVAADQPDDGVHDLVVAEPLCDRVVPDGAGEPLREGGDDLTVRQLAQRMGGYSGPALLGTPVMIADQMEELLTTNACDGFNIMFPFLPAGLDDFVERVVPELQRRGIFRREYEGTTLRENLGLPRPENRFFPPQK